MNVLLNSENFDFWTQLGATACGVCAAIVARALDCSLIGAAYARAALGGSDIAIYRLRGVGVALLAKQTALGGDPLRLPVLFAVYYPTLSLNF